MSNIFVALSGGVDSAVAAHMLQSEGHTVTGVFIRVWQPDFIPCSQEEEEKAALRVAASLGIPFRRIDLSKEYKQHVVDDMIAQYEMGNTPNPDVLCNSFVKFGAFLQYAKSQGADSIATGHHARVEERDGTFLLEQGVDPEKDQAYFLWQLTQEELSYTRMPIGNFTKQEIRDYAQTHALPSATKPDSQGLCFIGHVDMKTFLSHFIEPKRGNVLSETGAVIGRHDGAVFLTIGQRGGFTISDTDARGQTYYVIDKNIHDNTITVSTEKAGTTSEQHTTYKLRNVSTTVPPEHIAYGALTCQIRYHGEQISCELQNQQQGTADVVLEKPVRVAKGQSVVFYNDTVCVGGGIVA